MFRVIKLCHLTSGSRAAVTAELPARTPGQTLQLALIISSVRDPFIYTHIYIFIYYYFALFISNILPCFSR